MRAGSIQTDRVAIPSAIANGQIMWTGANFGTPNGHKAIIVLEELKEAYGKPEYVYQSINIGQNIQKEPWFTKYGPNGRIPVLIDHDNQVGFECIAEARNKLLRLGRKEVEDPSMKNRADIGCHVVAPVRCQFLNLDSY